MIKNNNELGGDWVEMYGIQTYSNSHTRNRRYKASHEVLALVLHYKILSSLWFLLVYVMSTPFWKWVFWSPWISV